VQILHGFGSQQKDSPAMTPGREGVQTCSNCGEPLRTGEAIKPDGRGGWRHPSKCGNEWRDLVVRPPPRTERK
jgi:hypothetical protein